MTLFEHIEDLLKKKPQVVIGIDGKCASGKSMFAKELQETYGATVFHMDDFFLPPEMKTKERLEEIGGNVHYERVQNEIFDQLGKSEIVFQKFDCNINQLLEPEKVQLSRLIVIEGAYSLRNEFFDYYDVTIMIDIDYETQLQRLERRNPRLLDRFISEWIPYENRYLEAFKIAEKVDYVITRN